MRTKDWVDRKTVEELERFLRAEVRRIRESVRNTIMDRSAGEAGRSPDLMVWATQIVEDEIQVAVVNRLTRQVTQIEAALERLAQREYGICYDCGEFIGLARLKALPFAQRCRPCQMRAEESQDDRGVAPVGAAMAAAKDD